MINSLSMTHPALTAAPRRPDLAFLFAHPAHLLALGFGSGLAPKAAGTVGTLWAWGAFLLLDPWLGAGEWGALLAAGFFAGWWAATVTSRHLAARDSNSIVWDEVLAFWVVLWLVMPAGFAAQLAAFVLFRFFDIAKPGPVAWAEAAFAARRDPSGASLLDARQGFAILFDDLVAALCTLLVIAVWMRW